MNLQLFILQLPEDFNLTDLEIFQKVALKLSLRLIIDLFALSFLLQKLYLKIYQKRDLLFTFYIFNIIIFFICYLLNKVDLSLGAAFGLFAVFGILRFKAFELSIKDMTYLFLTIAIGLINATAKIKGANNWYDYLFLLSIDAIIISICFWLEKNYNNTKEICQTITYDRMDLIIENDSIKIIQDLKTRTGIDVLKFELGDLDLRKGNVDLKIYYLKK